MQREGSAWGGKCCSWGRGQLQPEALYESQPVEERGALEMSRSSMLRSQVTGSQHTVMSSAHTCVCILLTAAR